MARNDIHFNTSIRKKMPKSNNYDEIRKMLDQAQSEPDDEQIVDTDFSDMKAITTSRGIKAILSGKVLNASNRKYRKWRKNDKRVIKSMMTPALQDMYDSGKIGYRKAKRVRRIVTKRILSCFYAKAK